MLRQTELETYLEKSELREALGIPRGKPVALAVLGQGEYNLNYRFDHPLTGQKLVLRVNTGSQMHLQDQIEYEYRALRLLENSGRTPRAYYVDGSKRWLPWGVLVMEFLPGRPLVYGTDLTLAAQCLADIHSTVLPAEHHLLCPGDPLAAMLAECREMAGAYLAWPEGETAVKERIAHLLDRAEKLLPRDPDPGRHIINTELNSGNFLVGGAGGNNYLIDWEKPILGQVEQDLGHFLAPTTTFWKTDTILDRGQMEDFLSAYRRAVDGRFDLVGMEERFERYLVMTCLRGITWCAMAYVEYATPGRALRNESTFRKIKDYLEEGFLDRIRREYFSGIS